MKLKSKLFCLSFLLLLVSCQQQKEPQHVRKSAYYWSTEWRNEPRVVQQVKTLDKLYLRYFDVVMSSEGEVTPNATLQFAAEIPDDIEVIPVVFIVNDVMKSTKNAADLAQKVLRRVFKMNKTNDVRNFNELQIDCDWTFSTRRNYYAFLMQLHHLAAEKHIALSTTIRLHQLSQSVPPVDKGVLMMYNTGDFTDIHCEHPILDMKDVMPYLKYLKDYSLPLSPAYPLFSYRLLFRHNRYKGVIHADNDLPVLPGDSIIVRKVSVEEVLNVKQTIENIRPELRGEIIIYDLSPSHIANYKLQDYEEIYRAH